MSRFRLLPTPAQQAVLRDHCGHARYVWNLAVEQHSHWRPGRAGAGATGSSAAAHRRPGEYPWLAAGAHTVQQQALRDFTRAMTAFLTRGTRPGGRRGVRPAAPMDSGSSGARPEWDVRRVPQWARSGCPRPAGCASAGPVAVPPGAKSYRVTMDRAGRWHIAFAVIPDPVPG